MLAAQRFLASDALRGGGRQLLLARPRLALFDFSQNRPRPLRRALVPRSQRDLIEIVPIRDAIDRRQRRLAELAVQRHAQDLALVAERLERRPPHRFVLRVPRDRSDDVRIAEAGQRADRDRLARRALRDHRERLEIAECVDRRQAVGLADALEDLERDVAQHRHCLLVHRRIGVARRDRRQRRRIHQLRHRRPPHPRLGVVTRDLGEQLALGDRDFLHEGKPDGGIGMLLTWLRAKSIEQCHVRSRTPNAFSLSTTSAPCEAARTFRSTASTRPSAPMTKVHRWANPLAPSTPYACAVALLGSLRIG